jgi:uncharacterized protein
MKKIIFGIDDSYSSQILKLFKNLPKETEIILFGSRAKGNFREGSDIDLCLKKSGLKIGDLFSFLEEYQTLNLPWKLDLTIYELIQEPALKEHIDRIGIFLPPYTSDIIQTKPIS